MAKCEHHDDYLMIVESMRKSLQAELTNTKEHLEKLDRKAEKSHQRIDELNRDVQDQRNEHKETETYVKELYKKVDSLTGQIHSLVLRMDQYFAELSKDRIESAKTQSKAFGSESFIADGKKLIFEIIKWLVIYALVKAGLSQ